MVNEEIYNIITTRLDDFEQFGKYIVEFLEKEEHE